MYDLYDKRNGVHIFYLSFGLCLYFASIFVRFPVMNKICEHLKGLRQDLHHKFIVRCIYFPPSEWNFYHRNFSIRFYLNNGRKIYDDFFFLKSQILQKHLVFLFRFENAVCKINLKSVFYL